MGTTTLLIGLGKGGSALLPYLLANPEFDLIAVCDSSREAVGVPMARRMQIPFFDEPVEAVRETSPQLVIDASNDPSLPTLLYEVRPAGTSLVTAEASRLLWVLLAALEGKRRAELRYDRLLSDMSTGLVVVQESRIRFTNPAFLQMFGYSTDQLIGRPYSDILHKDVKERDMGYYRRRVAGESVADEYETMVMHADGSVRNIMVRARRSEWDGRIASLVMMTDVSMVRELQRERERFFRFMVHELRAPLSPLVTAVSLLKDPGVVDNREHLERLLPLIRRSTERLRAFIDDFLELSKLSEEALVVTQGDIQIEQTIHEIVENQRILAEDKGLELRVVRWTPFPVRGDAFCVRTIAQNLINNAIKYTNQGSITVSVARSEEMFTLNVSDTGAGLTAEEQKNLFQEFGRIQRMAGVKGTGLGLALVKKLVSACGGRIVVESGGKDKGSTFSVSLPYVFGTPPGAVGPRPGEPTPFRPVPLPGS